MPSAIRPSISPTAVYAQTSKAHETRYAVNLAVYHALKQAEITIPFPQRDVHLTTVTQSGS
ncbi:MAG: small-conductance mechanosensitive channel [Lentimonas sp.]|jgi:small-conductance mechanosensitive channel